MIKLSDGSLPVDKILFCAKEIDQHCYYEGNPDINVEYCSVSDEINEGDIIWLRNVGSVTERLLRQINTNIKAVIVCNRVTGNHIRENSWNNELGFVISEQPRDVYFHIIDGSNHIDVRSSRIGNSSIIETNDIAEGVSIGENCYIGPDVKIGKGVTIHNNVTIECPVVIGEYCNIYSGAVIGSYGFGYYNYNGKKRQIPHLMGVTIGHHTDIGANTCIDRGCLRDTVIGNHVKIDNLVHIAHNVIIGDECMVVAQAMLGGSSEYGDRTYIAPGAMVFDTVKIGEEVTVGVGAVVKNNVEDGLTVVGIPAHEIGRK